MRKALSDMTAQDLLEHIAALGMNRKEFAAAVGKALSTVSNYTNGRFPIPQDVAQATVRLVQAKAQALHIRASNAAAQVGQLITLHNQTRAPDKHRTEARFMRRQGEQDTTTFPVYRMSVEKYAIYVQALAAWTEHVRSLAREHDDEARQRDYALELADLQALASSAPRNAPYDVVIQRNEWYVVSRALRHLAQSKPEALALYQHWRKYKGCGFPPHRKS